MVRFAARFDAVDLGPTTIQVADDIALKFFRGGVFDLHDWLEQDRLRLFESILDRKMAASLNAISFESTS
jgi:hypothetical protein